jgi:hypothetical protein
MNLSMFAKMKLLDSSMSSPTYPKISFNYIENDSGSKSVNISLVLFNRIENDPKIKSMTDFIFGEILEHYDQALFVITRGKCHLKYQLICDTYDPPELFGFKIEKFISAVLHQLIKLKIYEANDKIYLVYFVKVINLDFPTYTLFHGLDSISILI